MKLNKVKQLQVYLFCFLKLIHEDSELEETSSRLREENKQMAITLSNLGIRIVNSLPNNH